MCVVYCGYFCGKIHVLKVWFDLIICRREGDYEMMPVRALVSHADFSKTTTTTPLKIFWFYGLTTTTPLKFFFGFMALGLKISE